MATTQATVTSAWQAVATGATCVYLFSRELKFAWVVTPTGTPPTVKPYFGNQVVGELAVNLSKGETLWVAKVSEDKGDFTLSVTQSDFWQVSSMEAPGLSSFVVSPSDTVDLPAPVRAVTIGTNPGAIRYTHARTGVVCTTGPLPVGQHPIWASRIWLTGTGATGLTGWE